MDLEQKPGEYFTADKVADPARLVQIEIGDSKQPEFLPQFKTLHWDNEVNLSVRLTDADPTAGAFVKTADGKIEWQRAGRTARFYDKPAGEEFELEVELSGPPASNVLEFTIQTKGLNFFRQPPLTEDEQHPDWKTVTETEARDGDGRLLAQRPENVVGSIAAYHDSASGNRIGGKDYRAGKAFHIYRPHAVDSKGQDTWCELKLDEGAGTLFVIVPQAFLDVAVYPVTIDPTFGYTTQGASSDFTSSPIGTKFTAPAEAGTISSITSYCSAAFGAWSVANAVYSDSAGSANNKLAEDAGNTSVVTGWNSTNLSHAFNASDVLWLALWASNANAFIFYDTGAADQGQIETGATFETWPSPFNKTFSLSRVYSIYATYTASGGIAPPPLNNPFAHIVVR